MKITFIKDSNVESIGNDFLHWNETLSSIELPNVNSIGNDFLHWNETIDKNRYIL